jgi:hypothetical protein
VRFEGASSDLLGEDDFKEARAVLTRRSTAALVTYENTCAAPFATALRRSDAQLVGNGPQARNAKTLAA